VDRQASGLPLLVCPGCGYAWEPAGPEWTCEHLRALAEGCPECGSWLYVAELADPSHGHGPREVDG
jgi:hypothetical protein